MELIEEGEVLPDERDESDEPTDEGGDEDRSLYSSDMRDEAKRRVSSSMFWGANSASRSWREA